MIFPYSYEDGSRAVIGVKYCRIGRSYKNLRLWIHFLKFNSIRNNLQAINLAQIVWPFQYSKIAILRKLVSGFKF